MLPWVHDRHANSEVIFHVHVCELLLRPRQAAEVGSRGGGPSLQQPLSDLCSQVTAASGKGTGAKTSRQGAHQSHRGVVLPTRALGTRLPICLTGSVWPLILFPSNFLTKQSRGLGLDALQASIRSAARPSPGL